MFHLLTNDREFADHNKGLLGGWLSTWTGRAIAAAGHCSHYGRSRTPSRRASRTRWTPPRTVRRHSQRCQPRRTEGLAMTTFKHPRPVQSIHGLDMAGFT